MKPLLLELPSVYWFLLLWLHLLLPQWCSTITWKASLQNNLLSLLGLTNSFHLRMGKNFNLALLINPQAHVEGAASCSHKWRNTLAAFQFESLEGRKPREVGNYKPYPEKKQTISRPQSFLELHNLTRDHICSHSPPSEFGETSFPSGIVPTPESTVSGTAPDP